MRRHGSSSDPTSRRVLGLEGKEILYSILDSFSERQADVIRLRFGLTDGRPRSLTEIARIYGISRYKATCIVQQAIGRIRTDSDSVNALSVWNEEGQVRDKESVDDFWAFLAPVDVVNTPSYVSSLTAVKGVSWCSQCREVPLMGHEISKGGRPRKYCSARCRQAAYQSRKASRTAP
jgi:hypothetical protein